MEGDMEGKCAKRRKMMELPEEIDSKNEEEDEEQLNLMPREHPLLNNLVVQKVFQYLEPQADWKTLKSIRQVCTVWRDESLNWWRKTAVLKLTPDEDPVEIKPFVVTHFTELMWKLQDPLRAYRLSEKPYHKYKLETTIIDIKYLNEQGTKAYTFWRYLGPQVKHLILKAVSFLSAFASDLMQFIITHFPNLETLEVDELYLNKCQHYVPLPSNFAQMQHPGVTSFKCSEFHYFTLSNFPNLQHFEQVLDYVGNFNRVMAVKDADGVYQNSTVKSLSLDLTSAYCRGSPHPRYKFVSLERLQVTTDTEEVNASSDFLQRLLKTHGEQLRFLEVRSWPFVRPYRNFPFECRLAQLTELHVSGNVAKDLSFLKWTPKLKLLYIDLYGMEHKEKVQKVLEENANSEVRPCEHDIVQGAVDKVSMADVVLANLEDLKINCGFQEQSLRELGAWMPNLKKLALVLWKGSISVIGELWPGLEQLVGLHGSEVTDEDVTGTEEGERGLRALTKLKRFHLNAACNEAKLTDAASTLGFLEMRELTDLQVCVSQEFTKSVEEQIKNHFPIVNIIRNCQDNFHGACCKNAQFLRDLQKFRVEDTWGSDQDESDGEGDDNESDEEEEEGGEYRDFPGIMESASSDEEEEVEEEDEDNISDDTQVESSSDDE